MKLAIFFLLLAATASGKPHVNPKCSHLPYTGELISEDGDGAEGLSEEEMKSGTGLTAEELLECFGVEPAQLSDQALREGDIMEDSDDEDYDEEERRRGDEGVRHSAIRNKKRLWPDGVVPYTLSRNYNTAGRFSIASAMRRIQDATCIRFRAKQDGDKDYIRIGKWEKGSCWSYVGRQGTGGQKISLPESCLSHGVIVHELLHAIGFVHEHNRADRDDFVRIQMENVIESNRYNFKKRKTFELAELGLGYDYGSIMHYYSTAFSKNGLPTIVRLYDSPEFMGQRYGLSETDVLKIRKLYGCDERAASLGEVCEDHSELCSWAMFGCAARPVRFLCPRTCKLC